MNRIPHAGEQPQVNPDAFIADGVQLVGRVKVAKDASIWFNSVIRADLNDIVIGERTNIQDCSILHVTETAPVIIGSDVTVGHRAIIHACTVEDSCLIGMSAILLDGVRVRANSVVAAGAVVLQNFEVPGGMLAAGVPAKVIRPLSDEEKKGILDSASNYVEYARGYRK